MHPILLLGAALVGLPIILHLIMKQEPRRLPFPAFRFLKQRLKTNQRKLRLRHFILLALRMLLIALFCLTLYQPSLQTEGVINIHGEQPVAVVLVLDTSPSTGDSAGEQTRPEDHKKLRDAAPDPRPAHAVIDVGVDQPANVAILSAEMKPQVIPASQPAVVTATVGVVGPDVEAVVRAKLDGGATERKQVVV